LGEEPRVDEYNVAHASAPKSNRAMLLGSGRH
jgi:hypothetical protein